MLVGHHVPTDHHRREFYETHGEVNGLGDVTGTANGDKERLLKDPTRLLDGLLYIGSSYL
jgi:hypothetical protein